MVGKVVTAESILQNPQKAQKLVMLVTFGAGLKEINKEDGRKCS